ncbi:MAG: hypothetical protein AB7N80_03370 [Bdellovibrionales bacterium]
MKKTLTAVLLLISWNMVACQSDSDTLNPAPVNYGVESNSAEGVKIEINPRVDVLFVIDNSGSMKPHIANLTQNINRFVEGIGKNNLLDFHIGVTTVWDSRRYGHYDVEQNKVTGAGIVPAIGRDKKPLFEPIGHLRSLKAPAGKEASLSKQAGNFVAKGDDFVEILRETLNVGIAEYHSKTDEKHDAMGPEYEEVFSPVIAALTEPVANAWNKGFLRPGRESHLVIVYITDANDASDISASHMHQFLADLKGRDNFSLFAIVNPSNQRLNCPRDPAGPPLKIEELMNRTRGKILNICGDYGTQLLQIGKMIQDRTLGEIRISLKDKSGQDRLPVVDKIQVNYGREVIPVSQYEGWTYDGETKEIVIRGAAKWPHQPGASININFEPVDPTRASSHRIEDTVKRK